MTTPDIPIAPILPWEEPSDTFTLFHGRMRYRAGQLVTPEIEGTIQLVVRAGVHLHWTLDVQAFIDENDEIWDFWASDSEPQAIELEFMGKALALAAAQTSQGRGILMRNRQQENTPEEMLKNAIVHWVNLPGIELPDSISLGEWQCRFRSRPNLKPDFKDAKANYLNLVTHVMEISRSNGNCFSASSLSNFIVSLQFGVSFALSRWVAPIMPVGFDTNGKFAWTEWLPWHIDPPMYGSGRWWVEHRQDDLWTFLNAWLASWHDADRQTYLRFIATSAIASGEGTVVEQRLMTTLAAIENMSWVSDVLSGKHSEKWWRNRSSHQRIRKLLTQASVPIHLDPALTPALYEYAKDNDLGDGPLAVVGIRDRITHPKNTASIYRSAGLISEAARLTRKYLDLLILHHLGYEGRFSDRTRVRGWVGESDVVPWIKPRT